MTGSEQVSSESNEERNTLGGGAVVPTLNDRDATGKGEGCGSGNGSELFSEAILKERDSRRLKTRANQCSQELKPCEAKPRTRTDRRLHSSVKPPQYYM